MKKQGLRIFLMSTLLAILSVSSVRAQSNQGQTANIPFSFTVGSKVFPAGQYVVTRLNAQSDKATLVIKSADGRTSKIVLALAPVQAGKVQERARLVFNRYGGQYFLSQVWTPADNVGLELLKSRSERTLARSSAGEHAPERKAIALSSRPR